jgi:hypothetical protein
VLSLQVFRSPIRLGVFVHRRSLVYCYFMRLP